MKIKFYTFPINIILQHVNIDIISVGKNNLDRTKA